MRLFSALALMGMLILPVSAHATCARQDEAAALNARALGSHLMVAALSCGQQAEYADFMRHYQPVMRAGASHIRAYFERNYGAASEAQLNRFVTGLANAASASSMKDSRYCENARRTFQALSKSKTEEIASFTAPRYATLHGIKTCSGI